MNLTGNNVITEVPTSELKYDGRKDSTSHVKIWTLADRVKVLGFHCY